MNQDILTLLPNDKFFSYTQLYEENNIENTSEVGSISHEVLTAAL